MRNKMFTRLHYLFFLFVMAACVVLSITMKLNWITLISCVSGIAYIVFLSDRNFLNFIVGFIATTTYIFVSFAAKLYGEVIFYFLVDLPMIFISYFMWKRNVDTTLRVSARKMSLKQIGGVTLISVFAIFVYSLFLKAIGGNNYIIDATSTAVSFIATVLMAKRYREQWFMWVIVYAISVVMWAVTFDLLMLIMSVSCLVSCFIGFINWSINARK